MEKIIQKQLKNKKNKRKFLFKKKGKDGVQKAIELKLYIGPLLPKWQPRTSFKRKII